MRGVRTGLVVLIVGLTVGCVLMGALPERDNEARRQCGPPVPATVSTGSNRVATPVSVSRATLGFAGSGVLQLRNVTTVTVPLTWAGARPLLDAPGSPEYQNAVSCLFEQFTPADPAQRQRDLSVRAEPPLVAVGDGDLVVTDTTAAEVPAVSDVYAGPVHVVGSAGVTTWAVDIQQPDLLRSASCEVTVEAPRDWLVQPTPEPSTSDRTSVTWRKCTGAAQTVLVRPDARGRALATVGQFPWGLMSYLLSWACYVAVAVIAIVAARRMRSPGKRNDDVPAASGPVARRARFENWSVESLSVAYLVFSVVVVLLGVVGWTVNLDYEWLILIQDAGLTAAIVWTARRWRLAGSAVAAVGVACVVLLLLVVVLLSDSVPTGRPFDDASSRALIGIESARLFLVLLLLIAAGANAARLLVTTTALTVERNRRGEVLCWSAGAVAAAALVVERYGVALAQAGNYHVLAVYPVPAANIYSGVRDALWSTTTELFQLAIALLAIGLVRRLRDRHEAGDAPDRRTLGGACAVLLVYAGTWATDLWGWTLPLLVVLVPLTFLIMSRLRSVLDQQDDDRSPVGERLAGRTREQLRVDARSWRTGVLEGRRLDNRLTAGEIDGDEHRRRSDELAVSDRRIMVPVDKERSRYRALTPMDVLLAHGPCVSPLANARQAALLTAGIGVVVNVFLVAADIITGSSALAVASTSPIIYYVQDFLETMLSWTMIGFVVGLLWRHLPGRRGPLKVALPLLLLSFGQLADTVVVILSGTALNAIALVQLVVLWGVLVIVGLVMDLRTLRPSTRFWSTGRQALSAAYGLDHVPTQIAFVLAQASAVIAIVTFLAGPASTGETSTTPQPGPGTSASAGR